MKKQISYANALNVPFFAMIGEDELAAGTVGIKNMTTGEQISLPTADIANFFENN